MKKQSMTGSIIGHLRALDRTTLTTKTAKALMNSAPDSLTKTPATWSAAVSQVRNEKKMKTYNTKKISFNTELSTPAALLTYSAPEVKMRIKEAVNAELDSAFAAITELRSQWDQVLGS